jgi:hypothetical protein
MKQQIQFCDQALVDLAFMFHSCKEDPTPWNDRLNASLLDFSVHSLDCVNVYLDAARKEKQVQDVWNIICLRAGAYLGEVIRRNGRADCWHWLDYENACKVSPDFAKYPKGISTCAVLHHGRGGLCFPLGKIAKYLENGSEDNARFFAEVIIAKWKEAYPA